MEFWRRKKEAKKSFLKNGSMFLEELIKDCNGISNPIRMFSSAQIIKATNHISAKCSLSEHAVEFYPWYKGVIEGRPYAIKEPRWTTCFNNIALSARVSNHSGFLKLIGCCLELPLPVLVFENTEYGVLNERGSVGSEEGPLLPWNVRLKIAKEVAIAVTYLHTAFPRIIIHRDIKPANVLLDKNWNAKLTDFSLSVTLPEGKTWIEDPGEHYSVDILTTQLMETFIDPNSFFSHVLSEYTDVFSFGISMLVLLMGKPAIFRGSEGHSSHILTYVKNLQKRGEPVEFGGDLNDMRPGQMNKFLELALRCCKTRNEDRPKMIVVAKELKLIESSLDC